MLLEAKTRDLVKIVKLFNSLEKNEVNSTIRVHYKNRKTVYTRELRSRGYNTRKLLNNEDRRNGSRTSFIY